MKLFIVAVTLMLAVGLYGQELSPGERKTLMEDAHRNNAEIIRMDTDSFLERLRPHLTRSERKAVDSIVFDDPARSIVHQWEIPYAYRRNGKSHVRVTAGLASLVIELSVATTLAYAKEITSPAAYFRYIGNSIRDNREGGQNNSEPRSAKTACQFYDVPYSRWDKLMETKAYKDHLMGFKLMFMDFILAHEIGHNVLKHTERRPASLEESRSMETEADDWAVEVLLKMDELPMGGMFFCLLLMFSREGDLIFEDGETHPTEFRRILGFVEVTSRNVQRLRTSLEAAGLDVDGFEEQMKSFAEQIREEFVKAGGTP